MEAIALVEFVTPRGDPLINIVYKPIYPAKFNGWPFYKFNPWKTRFNKFLRQFMEAGLVEYYQEKTFERARKQYYASDKEKNVIVERPTISKMTFDDLQGLFYITGLLLAFSMIVFFIEKCSKKS